MDRKFLFLLCGVAAVVLLFLPTGKAKKPDPVPPVVAPDLVSEAFDTYEKLWRQHAKAAADKLAAGEFKSDALVWDFLAAGQEPARKAAFEALAKSEQDYFVKQNGWSAIAHEKLLRSYVK